MPIPKRFPSAKGSNIVTNYCYICKKKITLKDEIDGNVVKVNDKVCCIDHPGVKESL